MFANGELARLAERKALLLAQSRRNREQLILDCTRLQPALSWVETASNFVRKLMPVGLVVAPLLGFWAGRKKEGGFWTKLQSGLRLW